MHALIARIALVHNLQRQIFSTLCRLHHKTVGLFAGKGWGDEEAALVAAALAPRLNPDGTWIFNGALNRLELSSKFHIFSFHSGVFWSYFV